MLRPTWAEIDLEVLDHNLALARAGLAPNNPIWPEISGEAYGHGLIPVAQRLAAAGPPLVAVGNVAEGVRVRQAGVTAPVLVLDGVLPGSGLEEAYRWNLACAVPLSTDPVMLRDGPEASRRNLEVYWRVEASPATLPEPGTFAFQWQKAPWARVRGLLVTGSSGTEPAIKRYRQWLRGVQARLGGDLQLHYLTGEALPAVPEGWLDGVGVGPWLYGLFPGEISGVKPKPAMSWRTRVAFVKDVSPGTGVSYGITYRTQSSTRLATLPVGYADGLRRGLSNRLEVLVRGRRVPQVGRICMDKCVIDVGGGGWSGTWRTRHLAGSRRGRGNPGARMGRVFAGGALGSGCHNWSPGDQVLPGGGERT